MVQLVHSGSPLVRVGIEYPCHIAAFIVLYVEYGTFVSTGCIVPVPGAEVHLLVKVVAANLLVQKVFLEWYNRYPMILKWCT